jgi:predicted PurR-regulated permease PerM
MPGMVIEYPFDFNLCTLQFGCIVIQQIANNLPVPRIQGKVMKMHPVFIILVSVMGAYLGGLVGFIIAVPLTATFIELFKYFKDAAHR